MIDDKQYADLLDNTLMPMLQGATGGERATVSVLVAVLSELRTAREIGRDTNIKVAKLAAQFEAVSAGGKSLLTERIGS